MKKLKESHIKWWHVLRTYLNIIKIVTKPKPIGKCSNMIFNFFKNLIPFFLKTKWSNILFSYLFFTFVQNFKQRNKSGHDMCIWMIWITWSHFETITWIFVYDGCHNPFLEKIVSNLILWIMDWWQSNLRLGAHLKRWQRQKKMSKDECAFLITKLGWIMSPSF
jgi:hypothetical protein